MKNEGLLIANEIHPRRVWDLAENMERCGVTNAIITNEPPQHLSEHFVEFFDRVLLDAPCSGEGMFRKSLVASKEWNPEAPQRCAIRQIGILESASRMVKPGGCLAYTTCTFSPEENEGVIGRFLDNHPEYDLKKIDQKPGFSLSKPEWINLPKDHRINRAVRIWPYQSSGEGHYIALLVKNGSAEKDRRKKRNRESSQKNSTQAKGMVTVKKILDEFIYQNLDIALTDRQIFLKGSYVYILPEKSPDVHNIKIIHPGWWIGSIQKNRFSPSHALALAINLHQAKNTCSYQVGDKEISAFLGGESFANQGDDGWVLITVHGFPIGWGKRVQNVVKNYFPHGLRQRS
jgi:NOL1/NOP2/fmu family ribosome biogenesis protein